MSGLNVSRLASRTGAGDIVVPTGNRIISTDVGAFVAPGAIVQTVIQRNTTPFSTSSGTLQLMFEQSFVTKTASPILLVYIYCKQRVDVSASWNLGYFQIYESTTATQVAYSGYNGANANGWIHDYTTEKPYYATAPAGTSFNFQLKVASYSGTQYFNNPGQSSDDGYAIMKITEIAR